MSPGATSPTLGTPTINIPVTPTINATATINSLAQSTTHGMDQLAQASLQSARLVTQNPLYNFDTNNMSLNGNGLPGYPTVDVNSAEAVNPEVIQAIRSIPLVKQEKETSKKARTVNRTIQPNDTTNPPRGMMQ